MRTRWLIIGLGLLSLPACKREETTCYQETCARARYFNGSLQCVEWSEWTEPCVVYRAWWIE